MTKDISKPRRKKGPASSKTSLGQPGFGEGGQEALKPSKALTKALEAVKNMGKRVVH